MVGIVIVLDTHAAIWWSQDPELMGREASASIHDADRILIPSIVFWETALLVRKRRLELKSGISVVEWAEKLLSIPRVTEEPLTHLLAIEADALSMHPDPADRFITATAIRNHAILVTKDQLLRDLSFVKTAW